jgi:CheY-like chemotaxis protein
LVERIKEDPSLVPSTLIMMLTSGGQRGDAARCRALGVTAYLTKPVRQAEFRSAILTVLGSKPDTPEFGVVTRHSLRQDRRSLEARRILLAGDNAVNQRLAVRLLQKGGHRVVVASNGYEALEALQRDSFDLVLMDVQMPAMDGFEATAAIREKER